MTRSCDDFLESPELHGAHLDECESCRRLDAWLNVETEVKVPPVTATEYPVAPWEGATHRSWPVVLAIAAIVLAGSALLFVMAGVSPLEGFSASAATISPQVHALSVAGSISQLIRNAPVQFHIFVAVAFVLINILFVVLMRRPTKGYDITLR